jgi:hypothetical protein
VRESRPGSEHLRQIGAHQVAAIMQAAVAFRAVAVELLIPFSSCCRCDRTFSILDAKHVKLVKLVFDVAEDQIRSGPQPSRASSPGANTKLLAAEAPHTSSIWPSSGHIFMFIGIDGDSRGASNGGSKTWHFSKRVTPPNTTSRRKRTWRGSPRIRAPRRRDQLRARAGERERAGAASKIYSVLQRVTATLLQEIDKLITELRVLRDMLSGRASEEGVTTGHWCMHCRRSAFVG